MGIDDIPEEDRRAFEVQLKKEWDTQARLKDFKEKQDAMLKVQEEHAAAIKAVNGKVDGMKEIMDSIHAGVELLQNKPKNFWSVIDKSVDRVVKYGALIGIFFGIVYGTSMYVDSLNKVVANAKSSATIIKP